MGVGTKAHNIKFGLAVISTARPIAHAEKAYLENPKSLHDNVEKVIRRVNPRCSVRLIQEHQNSYKRQTCPYLELRRPMHLPPILERFRP